MGGRGRGGREEGGSVKSGMLHQLRERAPPVSPPLPAGKAAETKPKGSRAV